MNPDSTVNINAIEACPIDQLDVDAARKAIEEANRKLTQTGLSEADKATIKAQLEVFEAVTKAK